MAEVVTELLTDGADPNYAAMRGGATALATAAQHGNLEAMRALLDKGAAVDMYGGLALWSAAYTDNDECARALISAGASPDLIPYPGRQQPHSGETPLMSSRVTPSMVRILCEGGANVNFVSIHGHTPLSMAIALGNFEAFSSMHTLGAKSVGRSLTRELDYYDNRELDMWKKCDPEDALLCAEGRSKIREYIQQHAPGA